MNILASKIFLQLKVGWLNQRPRRLNQSHWLNQNLLAEPQFLNDPSNPFRDFCHKYLFLVKMNILTSKIFLKLKVGWLNQRPRRLNQSHWLNQNLLAEPQFLNDPSNPSRDFCQKYLF